jgi:tagaturonate reductase
MKERITPIKIAGIINRRLEQLMPIFAPLGVALGFLLPFVFMRLRPAVSWLFGIITFSGALKLRTREFGVTIRKPLPILLFFISSHIIMPLAAILFANLFFRDSPDTIAGYLLLYCGPVAVSAFVWTGIYRGDGALCLTVVLLDALLTPLVMPGTLSLLIGAKTAINMSGIAISLVIMVVIPTIVGVTLNEASRAKIPSLICPYLDPVSKLFLILVISANTSTIARQLHFNDPLLWRIAALCIFLSILGFTMIWLVGIAGRQSREKRVSLFFSGGLRNINVAIVIAVDFFPSATILPILISILFQQTIAALVSRLGFKNEGDTHGKTNNKSAGNVLRTLRKGRQQGT